LKENEVEKILEQTDKVKAKKKETVEVEANLEESNDVVKNLKKNDHVARFEDARMKKNRIRKNTCVFFKE
jgi:hypothetical protein